MAAFTYLCEKVNISLFNDTITIYPKLTGMMRIVQEAEAVLNNDDKLNEKISYVKGNHSDHDLYHQDNIDRKKDHYHMKFQKEIDEPKFNQILSHFAKYKLITQDEKENCLKTYRAVKDNLTLPSTNLQNIASSSSNAADISVKSMSSKQSIPSKLSLEELQIKINQLYSKNPKQQVFIDQFKIMTTKALQLKEKAQTRADYDKAAISANTLCFSLYDAYLAFDANKTQRTFVKFKETSNQALDLAKEHLQEHREWQGELAEILANIGLAILMLGLGYVGYGLYNKFENNDRFMFFRIKTGSIENLNGVKSALDQVDYTEIASI